MPIECEVSILLPYRNAEATVQEAISSVLADDELPIEIIAVDDGSRDASAAIVRSIAEGDERVRSFATAGIGIPAALNLAARYARAPWLARMDADDVSLPGRFRAQRDRMLVEGSLGAVGCRVRAFPEDAVGEGLARYVRWQNGLLTADEHARDLFVESPLCHPSVMIRRAAFERVGGYREGDFPEDYDLFLRLDAAGYRLAKLEGTFLAWRHQPGRATFADPRFGLERFRALKAEHLAPRIRAAARPLAVWGAGPTGRRLCRALERFGLAARRFIDIDPRKIGRFARGAPIASKDELRPGEETILVAVGSASARAEIRHDLETRGFREGLDYICAA